jgi:hypothetical protein
MKVSTNIREVNLRAIIIAVFMIPMLKNCEDTCDGHPTVYSAQKERCAM